MYKDYNKEREKFEKYCEFYCNYHKVGKVETLRICGNLSQALKRILGERNMDKKIIKLLRSGNFTLTYHDNGACDIYKGHVEYEKLPKKSLATFAGCSDGYIPDEVAILVEALGGKVDSI